MFVYSYFYAFLVCLTVTIITLIFNYKNKRFKILKNALIATSCFMICAVYMSQKAENFFERLGTSEEELSEKAFPDEVKVLECFKHSQNQSNIVEQIYKVTEGKTNANSFIWGCFHVAINKYSLIRQDSENTCVDTGYTYCETSSADTLFTLKITQERMSGSLENDVSYNYAMLKGTGEKKSPYLIETKEDFVLFRNMVNYGFDFNGKYVEQTADIDLSGENWIPIGIYNNNNYFYGTYNGSGHSINNLYINNPYQGDPMNVGLFGMLGGTIKNLGIENGDIYGNCIGGIASHGVNNPTIVNCYYKGNLTSNVRAGGIADNLGGTIANCFFEGDINSPEAFSIDSYYANKVINCAYNVNYACCPGTITGAQNNMKFPKDSAVVSEFLNSNFSQMSDQGFDGYTFNRWVFDGNGSIDLSDETIGCRDYIAWIMIITSFFLAFVAFFLLVRLLRNAKNSQTKKQESVNSDE